MVYALREIQTERWGKPIQGDDRTFRIYDYRTGKHNGPVERG